MISVEVTETDLSLSKVASEMPRLAYCNWNRRYIRIGILVTVILQSHLFNRQ